MPVQKLTMIQTLVVRCSKEANESPVVVRKCDDILMACAACKANEAIKYLTQDMRDAIIQGLKDCLSIICQGAWAYYMENAVPISDSTIPLLRTVCEYHYLGGT